MKITVKIVCIVITNSFLFKALKYNAIYGDGVGFLPPNFCFLIYKKFLHKYVNNS